MTLLFIAIIIDSSYKKDQNKLNNIQTISAITTLPPPALSANFLENRIRAYKDYHVYIYPKMQPIDYLGFVYAK